MRRLWLWGPVAIFMVANFYESSMTNPPLPGGMSDKLAHASGYVVLGALLARAVAKGLFRPLSAVAACVSVAIAVLYGASDELHQYFVPGRSADLRDLLADAVGAVVGVGVVWACGILWPRVARRHDARL